MQMFHEMVPFDGLWLDMDEVSNYCTGDVCQNPGACCCSLLMFLPLPTCEAAACCLSQWLQASLAARSTSCRLVMVC